MVRIFLNFMQFFGKFGRWRPLLRGILDPPLDRYTGGGSKLKILKFTTSFIRALGQNLHSA